MSAKSLAAAALLSGDCLALPLAAAAADALLHGGFDSRLLVSGGGVCLSCAAQQGDARGRSDLLDDVVVVNNDAHAVADVALVVGGGVSLALVGLSVDVVLTEPNTADEVQEAVTAGTAINCDGSLVVTTSISVQSLLSIIWQLASIFSQNSADVPADLLVLPTSSFLCAVQQAEFSETEESFVASSETFVSSHGYSSAAQSDHISS